MECILEIYQEFNMWEIFKALGIVAVAATMYFTGYSAAENCRFYFKETLGLSILATLELFMVEFIIRIKETLTSLFESKESFGHRDYGTFVDFVPLFILLGLASIILAYNGIKNQKPSLLIPYLLLRILIVGGMILAMLISLSTLRLYGSIACSEYYIANVFEILKVIVMTILQTQLGMTVYSYYKEMKIVEMDTI